MKTYKDIDRWVTNHPKNIEWIARLHASGTSRWPFKTFSYEDVSGYFIRKKNIELV